MRRLLVVFGLLGLVLAGCGDDDEPTISGSGDVTTTSSSAASEAKDAVDIIMSDYAYAVDGTLKAGGTLKLKNAGKEFHMIGVGKFKDGKTIADLQAALAKPPPEGEGGGGEGEERQDPTSEVIDEVELPVGAIFGPGQGADITVPDFGAGEYALICFIPTEGGGPPHFAQGMVNTLTVVAEKAAEPAADATYSITKGKAIDGPKTLTAGRQVLKLTAAPGSDDLEPSLVKPDDGKTIADMDKVFDTFDAEDFELPKNAADLVPGDLVVSTFDLGPTTTMYLTVDLTPGTYTLTAQDSDPDDAPSDPVEKILIKVS